jgi:hypothetical protein
MKYLLHLSTLSILVLSVPIADPLGAQQRHRVTGAPDQLLAVFAREPESSAAPISWRCSCITEIIPKRASKPCCEVSSG